MDNKIISILTIGLIAGLFDAGSSSIAAAGSTLMDYGARSDSSAVVNFPDKNLKAKIVKALGGRYFFSATNITVKSLQKLDFLNLGSDGIGYLHPDAIKNLSGLENCSNLKNLYLHDNLIRNLSPLRNLIGLEALHLSDNRITDIGFLENLVNLKSLDLSGNEISDFYPLRELSQLEWLSISPSIDTDHLPALGYLSNLKSLTVSFYGGDISFIEGLEQLRHFDLGYSYTDDLTPLWTSYSHGSFHDSSASISLINVSGLNPAWVSTTQYNNNMEIIRLLSDAGVNVHVVTD